MIEFDLVIISHITITPAVCGAIVALLRDRGVTVIDYSPGITTLSVNLGALTETPAQYAYDLIGILTEKNPEIAPENFRDIKLIWVERRWILPILGSHDAYCEIAITY
jgi:hypothetical protein